MEKKERKMTPEGCLMKERVGDSSRPMDIKLGQSGQCTDQWSCFETFIESVEFFFMSY